MAAVALEIDPTSEDAANVSIVLTASPFKLRKMELPPPPVDSVKASGVDVEGTPAISSKPQNRFGTIGILATSTTDALLQTAVNQLQQKLGKLYRDGGTLKITTSAATVVVADVVANGVHVFTPTFEHPQYTLLHMLEFELVLECKPYLRGAAVQLADHAETTLPALTFTDTSVGGDVDALGSLLIDNDSANHWWRLIWGIESNARYSFATSNALFWQAEACTALGSAAAAAGPTGASGAGSNVIRHTALFPEYQAILSTQATGGGAHMTHVGNFRVFARVQTPTSNTNDIGIAFEWAVGDFQHVTRNAPVTSDTAAEGQWRLIDLGLVNLTKTRQGTHRWEGRVVANSTDSVGAIDIDYLFFVPTDYGSGSASALPNSVTSSSFAGQDDFTGTTSGNNLSGRAAPAGGTWATSGDATDFVFSDTWDVDPRECLRRSTSVASTDARFAILGSSNYTNVRVECNLGSTTQPDTAGQYHLTGVIARWTDSSNFLVAWLKKVRTASIFPAYTVAIWTRVSGGYSFVGETSIYGADMNHVAIRLVALADGNASAYVMSNDKSVLYGATTGWSAALATGGTLATGKVGIYDSTTADTLKARYFDQFLVNASTPDAAVFAGQSLQVTDSYVAREESTGTIWGDIGQYEGDLLLVPPAGREARSVRGIVKPVSTSVADATIDDVSARLTVTPRYLVLPA